MRRLVVATLILLTSVPLAAAITGSVINTDGQPVAGAKVTIFAPETPHARLARLESTTPERAVLASTTTNAKGLFSVDPPKAALYLVEIEASGFAPEESEVVAGDDVGAIALTAAQTKTGKVTADGKPVANALVCWLGNGSVETLAHTDDQGRYSVADPAKWASRLVVRHPDYAMESKTFEIQDRIAGADVALTTGMTLAGGVVAEDGQTPVAKATVMLSGFTVATTGNDGRFIIAHAPKRWESLTAVAGDRIGTITQASKGTTIHLAKGSFVSGTLRDAKTQTPIVGAIISAGVMRRGFATVQPSGSALTDAKGSFAIGPLPPASYDLTVSRAGYVGLLTSVPLVAGQKVTRPMAAMQLARVSGVVVDENKAPVAGAVVAPQQVSRGGRGAMFMFRAAQAERTAYSGADGRFSAFAPEGDLQVTAQKSGWPPGHSETLRVAAGERKANITITVPHGIAVNGRVVDQNGKPVAGASVATAEAEGGGFGPGGMRRMIVNRMRRGGGNDPSVHTGNDGTFTVRLKEGTYDFVVSHEGFSHANLSGQHVTTSMKPLEVRLDPSVEITGRVVRSGAGVAGATVGTASMGGDFASDMTQGDGSFRLADLSPGQMMLVVSKPDEFVQTIKPVTAPAKDLVIELPAGGTVSGRVVDKSAGKPITSFEAGVTVPRGGGGMMVMTPPMMQAFNSDDGSFTLENVPAGQVQITASAPGYVAARVSTTVAEGKPVTGLEIPLDSGVKLSGRVTGPDGAALAGVAVTSMPAGRIMRMGPPETTTTDGNGEYSLDALDPGDHSFSFSWSTLPPVTKSVNLSGKETHLDVQLSAGVHVNGMVVTDSGAPVADAQVRASSAVEGSMGNATQTDAGGGFMFDGLMPGHYTFTASKQGYAEGILRDFDISSGAPVRVTMAGGGTIFGHVGGISGNDLAQARVSASSPTGGASAAVDSSGNYRIEGSPTGTVRVQASVQQGFSGGRSAPPQTVNVDPGGSVQVDLQFQSSTVITGRVTSAGMPLDSAMIAFFPREGNAQTNARTTTGSDGTYSVTGLDDALYGVSINDINRGISYSTQYQVRGSGTFDIDMKVMTVRGHVLDSSTGQGINNAIVEVRGSGTGGGFGMRAQPTDSNGYYQFDSVVPGSYQATAAKDGYGNSLQSISVSDSAVDLDFKLTPQAGVTLTVIDARDHQQLAANVRVYDSAGADVYDSPFRFGGGAGPINLPIAAGTYRAVVSAQGYATETITITSPSQPTVALTPGGTIVIHRTSGPAARLRILNADGTPYTRGGSLTGTFPVVAAPLTTTIPYIASGTYTLQLLDANGGVTASQTVTVPDGGTVDVQM